MQLGPTGGVCVHACAFERAKVRASARENKKRITENCTSLETEVVDRHLTAKQCDKCVV